MLENGNGSKGPWWVRFATSVMDFVKTIGVVGAVALGLVIWMMLVLTPVLQSMATFMVHHEDQEGQQIKSEADDTKQRTAQWGIINGMQDRQHNDNQLQRKDYEAQLELEQQTCINAAKAPYQTEKCLEIRNNGEKIGTDGR